MKRLSLLIVAVLMTTPATAQTTQPRGLPTGVDVNGFNGSADLINPDGSIVTPPIPPAIGTSRPNPGGYAPTGVITSDSNQVVSVPGEEGYTDNTSAFDLTPPLIPPAIGTSRPNPGGYVPTGVPGEEGYTDNMPGFDLTPPPTSER
jgi:hypothetical protein